MSMQRPAATWVANNVTVDGTTSQEKVLEQHGADKLTVIVTRSSNYNVVIEWLDPSGNVVNSETPASLSAVSGTNRDTFEAPFWNVNVRVEDAGTADSATADIQANLR